MLGDRVLYFFFQEGCSHCDRAKPALEEWKQANIASTIVVSLNCSRKDWNMLGYKPAATPAYLLAVNGQVLGEFEGGLNTMKQVDAFVKRSERGANGHG